MIAEIAVNVVRLIRPKGEDRSALPRSALAEVLQSRRLRDRRSWRILAGRIPSVRFWIGAAIRTDGEVCRVAPARLTDRGVAALRRRTVGCGSLFAARGRRRRVDPEVGRLVPGQHSPVDPEPAFRARRDPVRLPV